MTGSYSLKGGVRCEIPLTNTASPVKHIIFQWYLFKCFAKHLLRVKTVDKNYYVMLN